MIIKAKETWNWAWYSWLDVLSIFSQIISVVSGASKRGISIPTILSFYLPSE